VAAAAASALALVSLEVTAGALSLALLMHGLCMIGIGGRFALRPARHLGLAMLCAAGAKIGLIDIWGAGAGNRIALVLALGGGLLAASYLYSRGAEALEQQS
jgi:hypothetical protein